MSLSRVPIFPSRSSTIGAPLTRDTSVANMHNLYLTSHRIPVVALSEEYSVPFPSYLDNKSYQHVAENEMHMHNHDFNVTAELVCFDLFFFWNANSLAVIFLMLHFCLLFYKLSLPSRILCTSIGNFIFGWTMPSSCDAMLNPTSPRQCPR